MRFLPLFLSACLSTLLAQTPKTVLVEHFTNSRCSICASKNPAFNATMAQHPDVLRLTFHPSAPYSNCYFSQQNPAENDARTKFYGAYGATPRLALQGKLRTSSGPLVPDSALVNAAGQMTFLEIKLTLTRITGADFSARVKIFRTGAGDASNLQLFACISETVISYNAPNGETLHRNVFLKALTPAAGQPLLIGDVIGDSTSMTFLFQQQAAWGDDLELTALVQQGSTKALVQAARTTDIALLNAIHLAQDADFQLYPNPARDHLMLSSPAPGRYSLLDAAGREIMEGDFSTGASSLNISTLAKGMYFLQVHRGAEAQTVPVWKE